MTTDKIIGLIETTRGFTFKLIADLYGGPRFENQDLFSIKKASCKPEDEEEVSELLYCAAKRDVVRAVNAKIASYSTTHKDEIFYDPYRATDPAVDAKVETPPQVSMNTSDPTPPAQPEKYHVAEKAPEPTTTNPEPAKPLTAKELAAKLDKIGVTKDELRVCVTLKFPDVAPDKIGKDHYVAAFTEALEFIGNNSIETFRREITARQNKAPASPVTDTKDPAVAAAMGEVSKKWPMWSVELTHVAGLWLADHVKDASALEAFLIAAGVTATTSPGKIEALLAISRHLAYGSAAVILKLAQDTGKPISQIEAEIDAIVGKRIRFATDIPDGVVSTAFNALSVGVKK